MPEWRQDLRVPLDPERLAGLLWSILADSPPPAPLGFDSPASPGTTERHAGSLRLRETWEMQITRDDEILACTARTWDATFEDPGETMGSSRRSPAAGRGSDASDSGEPRTTPPARTLRLEWWPTLTRVTLRAEASVMPRAQAALWDATGQSPDEVEVLEILGASMAFSQDSFGTAHTRLRDLRYTPARLGWRRVGDDTALLTTLDRLADPGAVLAAALIDALAGNTQRALARVEGATNLDLQLLRADLLSRLGRPDEAAIPTLAPTDPQAHSAGALRVAVLHRAGRLADAARAALDLGELPWGGAVWPVLSAHARAVAAILAEDAGDTTLAAVARERLGVDAASVRSLAERGISAPAQWFLVAHTTAARLAAR